MQAMEEKMLVGSQVMEKAMQCFGKQPSGVFGIEKAFFRFGLGRTPVCLMSSRQAFEESPTRFCFWLCKDAVHPFGPFTG